MSAPARRWRRDIQGLRALAVAGVLLFHAGVPFLDGGFAGVDVFFVISGFLITQNLLREHAETGRVRLGRFYLGRLIRLAPAALATIASTVAAVFLFLPPLDRSTARIDGLAALLGIENLHLARTGTDYLADHAASPFQQFWSLGVEEQFYVAWALGLAVCSAVSFLWRHLAAIIAGVCALSFGALLVTSAANGPWAFFGVHTRAWELGVGALVAVVSARQAQNSLPSSSTLSRFASTAVAPLGLGLILACYLLFDESTPFPGIPTLVPVVGALLVVVPGPADDPTRRALGTAVLRWVGDRSYSLYLWHWPILVLPTLALDRSLTWWESGLGLALSVAVGWFSHRVFETGSARWFRSRRRRVGWIPAAAAVIAVGILPATTLPVLRGDEPAATATPAAVLSGPAAPSSVPSNLTPSIGEAGASLPSVYRDGCHADSAQTDATACTYGSALGAGPIVLFGDSHAAQWTTPLTEMARSSGRELITLTKSSCPAADMPIESAELGREYHECATWRSVAIERIARLQPSVVVVSNASAGYEQLSTGQGDFADRWAGGLHRTLSELRTRASAPVAVIEDTPRWHETPNRCLSASIDDVARCAEPRERVIDAELVASERTAARSAGAVTIDPVPWVCSDVCSPVLWNVLAYRDSNHITDELARALTPRLAAALSGVGTTT